MKALIYVLEDIDIALIEAIKEYLVTFGYDDIELDIYRVKEPLMELNFGKMMQDYVIIFTMEDNIFGKTSENVGYENIIKVQVEGDEVHFLQFFNEDLVLFDKMIELLRTLNYSDVYNQRRIGQTIRNLKDFKHVL